MSMDDCHLVVDWFRAVHSKGDAAFVPGADALRFIASKFHITYAPTIHNKYAQTHWKAVLVVCARVSLPTFAFFDHACAAKFRDRLGIGWIR